MIAINEAASVNQDLPARTADAALTANSLCRVQEKRTMRELSVELGNFD